MLVYLGFHISTGFCLVIFLYEVQSVTKTSTNIEKREYNLSAYILYTVHLLSSKCSPFWWRQE